MPPSRPAAIALFGVRAFVPLAALGFVMDAMAHPLYGLSVAQTNDYVARDEFVPAAGGLLLAYSIGASIGPTASSLAIAALGPSGLFAFIAVMLLAPGGVHAAPHAPAGGQAGRRPERVRDHDADDRRRRRTRSARAGRSAAAVQQPRRIAVATRRRPASHPTSGSSRSGGMPRRDRVLPQSPLPAQVDVAVIGSGHTGLVAALTLARAGRRVAVFDAGDAGQGASSRNAGYVGRSLKHGFGELMERHGLDRAVAVYRDMRAAFDWVFTLVEQEQIACKARPLRPLRRRTGRPGSMRAWRANTRCASAISANPSRCCRAPVRAASSAPTTTAAAPSFPIMARSIPASITWACSSAR